MDLSIWMSMNTGDKHYIYLIAKKQFKIDILTGKMHSYWTDVCILMQLVWIQRDCWALAEDGGVWVPVSRKTFSSWII